MLGHFLENEPKAVLDAGGMASPCSKVSPAVFKSIPKSTVDANAASALTQDCPVPGHQHTARAPASHTTAFHTQLQSSATAQQESQAPPIHLSQPQA